MKRFLHPILALGALAILAEGKLDPPGRGRRRTDYSVFKDFSFSSNPAYITSSSKISPTFSTEYSVPNPPVTYQLPTNNFEFGSVHNKEFSGLSRSDSSPSSPPHGHGLSSSPLFSNYYSPPRQSSNPASHSSNEKGTPYHFGYTIEDDFVGNNFGHREASDGTTVKGEYKVLLPDGRTQIVTYTADHVKGYQAVVRYEGSASSRHGQNKVFSTSSNGPRIFRPPESYFRRRKLQNNLSRKPEDELSRTKQMFQSYHPPEMQFKPVSPNVWKKNRQQRPIYVRPEQPDEQYAPPVVGNLKHHSASEESRDFEHDHISSYVSTTHDSNRPQFHQDFAPHFLPPIEKDSFLSKSVSLHDQNFRLSNFEDKFDSTIETPTRFYSLPDKEYGRVPRRGRVRRRGRVPR